MKRHILSFLAFLTITISMAVAQNVQITTNSQPTSMVSCGPSQDITVTVKNVSGSTIDNVFFTPQMDPGLIYVAGSVSGTGVSESDISVPNAPIYELPDLINNQQVVITFSIEAACFSYSIANIDFVCDYNLGGIPISTTTPIQTPINIQTTTLNINSSTIPTSILGHLGDTITVNIIVEAANSGYLSSFNLYHDYGQNLDIFSNIGVVVNNGSMATITLSGTDFASAGDGDNLFEPGESLTIIETIIVLGSGDLNGAPINTTYLVAVECLSQTCQIDQQFMDITFNTPPIFSMESDAVFSDTLTKCHPDSVYAWFSNNTAPVAGDTQACHMFNLSLDLGIRHYTSSSNLGLFFLGNFWRLMWDNFRIAGQLVPVNGCALGANDPCSITLNGVFSSDPDGAGGLSDLDNDGWFDDLAFGDTIYYSYTMALNYCIDYVPNILDANPEIGMSRKFWIEPHFISQSLLYSDIDGDRFWSYSFDDYINGVDTDDFPTDAYQGVTDIYEFRFSRKITHGAPGNVKNWCPTKQMKWRAIIPAGYILDGAPTTSAGNVPVLSYSVSSDTVIIESEINHNNNVNNLSLFLPLQPTCASTAGPNVIRWYVDYLCDASCTAPTCWEEWVKDTSNVFYVHLTGCNIACTDGITSLSLNVERQTLGFSDLAQTIPLTPTSPGIRLDVAIACDSVKLYAPATVCDTFDNAHISVTYINPYPIPYDEVEQLEFAFAEVEIYDATTGIAYLCPIIPDFNFSNDTFNYYFDAGALIGSPYLPAGFLFMPGDSVDLTSWFTGSTDLPNNQLQETIHFRAYHGAFDSGGNLIAPEEFGHNFTVFNPEVSAKFARFSGGGNGSICDTTSGSLKVNHAFADLTGYFPGEFRTGGYPRDYKVELPDSAIYVPGSTDIFIAGHGWFYGLPDPAISNDTLIYSYPFSLPAYLPDLKQFKGEYLITFRYTRNCMTAVDDGYMSSEFTQNYYAACVDTIVGMSSSTFYHTNTDPALFYLSSDQQMQVNTDTSSFDMQFTNYALQSALFKAAQYSYLYFTSNSGLIDIVNVYNISSGTVYPITDFGGTFLAELGTIAQYETRDIRVEFTTASCAQDLISAYLGWNCFGYPDNNLAIGCEPVNDVMLVDVIIPQSVVYATFSGQTPLSPFLCDTTEFEISVNNALESYVYGSFIDVTIPPTGLIIIPGSSMMYYPSVGSYVSIPDPVLISGSIYRFDSTAINNILSDGLAGVGNPNGYNYTEYKIKFNVITTCDFLSGSFLHVDVTGYKACQGICDGLNGSNSLPVNINGVGNLYNTSFSFLNGNNNTDINICEPATFLVTLINAGNTDPSVLNDTTSYSDFIHLFMPDAVSYNANTFSPIHNAPVIGEPTTAIVSGGVEYTWQIPSGVVEGDSVVFAISLSVADTTCGTTFDLQMQGVSNRATVCLASNDTCDIQFSIGDEIFTLNVVKPWLDIDIASATILALNSNQEILNLDLTITNNGSDLQSTQSISIGIFNDTDASGNYSAGDDSVTTFIYNITLAGGSTQVFNELITMTAGLLCDLVVIIDPAYNCVCAGDEDAMSPLILLNAGNDASICTYSFATIGSDTVVGYSYTWTSANDPTLTYIGGNTNNPDVTFVYTGPPLSSPQAFTYTLTTDRGSCINVDQVTVTVLNTPIANAGFDLTICSNDTAIIVGGTGDTYSWNPLAGAVGIVSTNNNILNAYPPIGSTESYELVVMNNNGCYDVDTVNVSNYLMPNSTFSMSTISSCVTDSVEIIYQDSIYPLFIYDWDFSTLDVDTISNGHYFVSSINPGVFSVSLTVTNGICVSPLTQQFITINAPAIADFNLSDSLGCTGNFYTAVFTGVAGSMATYNWNFDGGVAIPGFGQGPHTIVWNTPGSHYVSLNIDEPGCETSPTQYASIEIVTTPISTFNISSSGICFGDSATVTFTGSASVNASYVWDFDGATVVNGAGAGPYTIAFAATGQYDFSLTINENGCSSIQTIQTIYVYTVPTSDFTLSPVNACENENIILTYTGNATPFATYNWNFAGANASPGVGQGPHTLSWTDAGNYSVSLDVTQSGCASTVQTQSITIYDVPTSNFYINAMLACAGTEVSVFYTGTADTSSTFIWDWDDAIPSTGIGMGPHTIYAADGGAVDISLIVVSPNGCVSDTSFDSIYFFDIPTADFTISDSVGCTGANYQYTVTYTGSASPVANYIWDFDGGVATPGTGPGPHSVEWAVDGPKVITLFVEENGCFSAPVQQMILLQYTPTAFFTINAQGGCSGNGYIIEYTGNGQANFSYDWNFGGGTANPGVGQGPHYLNFSAPGTYNLTLVVTNFIGCTTTFTASIVEPDPLVLPVSITNITCPGYTDGTATVSPAGGAGFYTYLWSTGATSNTISNLSPGTYFVTVTDINGCMSWQSITITDPLPETFSVIPGDVTCFGDADGLVMISTSGNNDPYQFSLNGNPPQSSGTFSGLAAGNYDFVITNANGCVYNDSFTISQPDILGVTLESQIILELGQSVILDPLVFGGIPPYSFDWGPDDHISCDNCESPTADPVFTTTYDVLIADANGCQTYATVIIILDKNIHIFVPNVFTPNNDNLNDLLYVFGEGIKDIELRVYDRWGEEIFITNNMTEGWDGTYKGKALNSDVFIYRLSVTLLDNTQIQKDGSVTLVR